jgi:hypothetical protein
LERQQAAATLGQLSGRGVIAGEQEASKGAEGLRGAETVAFNGKEYKPEELTQSPEFRDAATKYYDMTPQQRQELKAKAPRTEQEFYGWLDKNEELLKTLETQTSQTLDIAQTATNEAAGAYGVLSGAIKDPKKLEQLTGLKGPTKFGDKKQATTTKFGQLIESLATSQDPVDKARVEAISEFLNDAPPEYIDLLKDQGKDFFEKNSLWSNSTNKEEMKNKLTRWMWKRNDIGFLNGDKDVSQFGIPMQEYQDLVSSLASLGEDSDLQKMFDADKDGKLDSNTDINKRIKDKYGSEIGSNNANTKTLGEILGDLRSEATSKREAFPQEIRDGVLDAGEFNNLTRSPLSFDSLSKILRPGVKVSGDKELLINSAFNTTLSEKAPVALAVLQDLAGGFRPTNDRERVRGDLVNVQEAIKQLQGAGVPELGASRAAEALNKLNEWASKLQAATNNFQAEDRDAEARAAKPEQDRLEAERKAQAKYDATVGAKINAGITNPKKAATDITSYIGKRNPLRR